MVGTELQRLHGFHSIGAPAFRTIGIGKDRGTGGTNHFFGIGEDISGVGGALYILPTKQYCKVNINSNVDAQINAVVSNDEYYGEYVINTQIKTGPVSGENSISFIVKKGATITCTAERIGSDKTDYNLFSNSYTAGETNLNATTNEENIVLGLTKKKFTKNIKLSGGYIKVEDMSGNLLAEGNNSVAVTAEIHTRVKYTAIKSGYVTKTETISIEDGSDYSVSLTPIYTVKLKLSGGAISVSGNFVDNYGTVISTQMNNVSNEVTFKVANNSTITYTASKQYYNTVSSVSMTVTGNVDKTISLDKTKYFINSGPNYSFSRKSLIYKWTKTGNLTSDDDKRDNAYLAKNDTASITATVGNIPNNWTMYLDGCYVGTSSNTSVDVKFNDNGTPSLSKTNLSTDKNNNYTVNGSGAVNKIEIIFKASKIRNFYLDSVYFIVND